MRLPNGYGSVYKLSGNRRNPWAAAKTNGYEEVGDKLKRSYHIIGYYPTKAKALQALAEFNDNPYDLELSKVTFADIYEKWSKDKFDEDTNRSTRRNYEMAYKKCESLHQMKMSDIRPNHLQKNLDEVEGSYETVKRVQILYNQLYKWCMDHDCIKKNYAELTKVKTKNEPTQRERFSTAEVQKVWTAAENNSNAAIVLILLYSGVRIMELLDLKKEDVDLENQCFNVRSSKTAAGVRVVPIADKLVPFWKMFIERSQCDYAISNVKGNKMTYENFKECYWHPLMRELNINHTPHETRHTFISMMTAKNVNPTLIKKIVGHKSIMSLTEKVYTHPETQEMVQAVNLIVMC